MIITRKALPRRTFLRGMGATVALPLLDAMLPSLELAMDLMEVVGQCDNGYACVYQNNLSWSSPSTPLPAEAHPRVVFERLFGEGGSSAERRAALAKRASLLDWVREDIARLQGQLGAADRS